VRDVPVTSHDVARLAGVSQPSVSRALRDQPGVSAATRKRVRDAAQALAYVPSSAGRSLSTRTTGRVAIVADELSNPFYPALVVPLHDALAEAGYRTILVTDSGAKPAELEPLVDGSLDGVFLTTSRSGTTLPAELARRGVPFVLVNRELETAQGDSCVVANRQGAMSVAQLLASLGHQRVAAIFGPETTSTARERAVGFRNGLAEHGIALPSAYVEHSEFDYDAGRSAFLRLMAVGPAPTAVFCSNDVVALGACNAARAMAVEVPAAVTIVGFDDIAMAAWDVFQLTTVRAELTDLAAAAAELLLRRMSTPTAPLQRVEIPTTISLRGTHAPPAATERDQAGPTDA
jgi:LacI family transcriptional regulator